MTSAQSSEPAGDLGASGSGTDPAAQAPEVVRHAAHRWGFGAFLLVEAVLLASAAFVSAVLGPVPGGGPLPVRDVLIGTITPTVIATAVALLITRVRGNGPLADLRLSWRWDDVRLGLRLGLIGLVCTTVGAVVWTQLVGDENASSAIAALVEDQPMSVSAAVTMFLYLWLLGPICEEIIYRGVCWGAVERLSWGSEKWARIAAFLLSTAVFAASHLEPLRTTLLLVIAVPIGLARLFTGRLLGSIVAHQMNNFLPALAILLTALGVVS
ncbi:CPBP family intramembrane metalloprotease domain-containing protein [Amycolatopsis antarctica]|uniref:CPBP family intramembrane metalloprotease domain-containing protein n=1 Tax=Amycolatopsis antarctica TaxID=1854586 RepID=A0A263D6I0_9PSEU|nr:CPBP family intramembrane glutamic endopeptidase [Amycolatopsis antarctica]OZM74124.1 CPBP family intramembrane metalloprotease domain-containing protein [Amycolatopsis antarctica]